MRTLTMIHYICNRHVACNVFISDDAPRTQLKAISYLSELDPKNKMNWEVVSYIDDELFIK